MLTLQFKFDRCQDPKAALAAIRVRQNQSGLRLQGDLLYVPAKTDHKVRIGRAWSCEVYLLDADAEVGGVAKEHVQIEVTSQRCFVRDLATKNGTLLNGKWLGGPPAPYSSPASRTPSGRKPIQVGDVIQLPGISLTVVQVPEARPRSERPSHPLSASPSQPRLAAAGAPVMDPSALRLPAGVTFQPAASPSSPPELKGFKYAATLGGKPASGLTYLYERKRGKIADREKWVVKYFSFPRIEDLASLWSLLATYFCVEHPALNRLRAYSLVPITHPAHLALCFPFLKGVNLARSPWLDLAGIYDVISGTLGALAALHQQGLAHGHICAENVFLQASGSVSLADSGLNALRPLLGAELTAPTPSASNDLVALGRLCANLLGESVTGPQSPPAGHQRPQPQNWPGAPLQALASRLREEAQLTANQALLLLQAVPRPQVSRLLTVPEWRGLY